MNTIAFITSNIAPYRLMWFEELSKYFCVKVYYTKDKEKDREEGFLKHKSDKCIINKLNNPKDLDNKICFDVINAIKNNKDSLIIFDGFGTLTNMLGLVYCKIKNIEVFVNIDGFAIGDNMSELMKRLKKYIITNYCKNIFCSSEVTKKHLIKNGANPDNIYVHNFSSISKEQILSKPLTKVQKQKIRKELNIETTKQIVLGVGQFIPRKRFEDLIIAIKELNNKYELFILGGEQTKEYKELVGDNTNIHFINFVKPEEVYKYYQAADVFALTSQTDYWGLVLNEAIAQGIPVISSDNCVAGLSIIDGNGLLYETGNIEELKSAIKYCLSDENYSKLSKRSLEIAKDYNIEGMVERQLPILNKHFDSKISL